MTLRDLATTHAKKATASRGTTPRRSFNAQDATPKQWAADEHMNPSFQIKLRIVIGGDDAGFSYQSIISRDLASDARVAKVIHVGPKTELDKTAYSTFAIAAAEAVANGTADRAI
ncbi:hypothetical protein MY5147_006340 [Beauveria neobassiana]